MEAFPSWQAKHSLTDIISKENKWLKCKKRKDTKLGTTEREKENTDKKM